jgi:rod shape determining protein RodA
MLLIYHIVMVANNAKDVFATYICTEVIAIILFHALGNVYWDIPYYCIPLPFISCGGSSLMSSMFLIGLVLNISYSSKVYMFDQQ